MATKTNRQVIHPVDYFISLPTDLVGQPNESNVRGGPAILVTTKTGVDNPGYRARIRAGVSAGTPYTVSAQDMRPSPGKCSVKYYRLQFPGNFQPPVRNVVECRINGSTVETSLPSIDASIIQDTVNQANLAFLKKAKSKLQSFDGGTFLGELRETIHGIRHPADSLRRLIQSQVTVLKKRRPALLDRASYRSLAAYTRAVEKRNRRASRIARETWLEYQFHWAPLISDARSAAEALAYQLGRSGFGLEPVSVSVQTEKRGGHSFQGATVGAMVLSHSSYTVYRCRCRIVGAVKVGVDASTGFDARLWGFTPSEFIPTIWELLPWSWAIDYFSNVGDVLNALSFPSSALAWSSSTLVSSAERFVEPVGVFFHSGISQSDQISTAGMPGSLYARTFNLSRTPDPVITPSFKVDLSKIWSARRLANLGSVLSLRGGMRPY